MGLDARTVLLCLTRSNLHSLGRLNPRLPLLAIWKNQHQTELYIPPNASSELQKFFFQVQLDQVLYIPTLLIQVSSGAQTENLETEKIPTGREKWHLTSSPKWLIIEEWI